MEISLTLTTPEDLSELACSLIQDNNYEDVIGFIKLLDECAADYVFTSTLHEYFKTEMAKEDAVEQEDR